MSDDTRFRILILGDFHYGESYGRAGARILQEEGYGYSTQRLRPFIEASDSFLLNLETPLATKEEFPSPLQGDKRYIHWADPELSGRALAELGVDAVTLANNHTVDLGHDALVSSLDALTARNIAWFGAGRSREEAERPYRLGLPDEIGGGEIDFYGSFQYSRSHADDFSWYATDDSPGSAAISARSAVKPADYERRPDSFHIALPHWGTNYAWRSRGQERIANRLTNEGYDLILGHGSHTVQEIHPSDDRWIVYGIGNGNFQSGGRWKHFEETNGILPFGFWVMLDITKRGNDRRVSVNLYPVYSDNSASGFQPGPVNAEDFERTIAALTERAEPDGAFPNGQVSFAEDDLGHYIRLELADWPVGARPVLTAQQAERFEALAPLHAADVVDDDDDAASVAGARIAEEFPDIVTDEPNVYDDSESTALIREQVENKRNIGALVISAAATRDGAEIAWHGGYAAVLTHGERRVLVRGHRCTESHVSAQITSDKLLTKEFLSQAGVSTPSGAVATDSATAVAIQRQIGTPVVVKPRTGGQGKGVTVGLTHPDEIVAAFDRATVFGGDVLVEEYIDGVEFRILASPDGCYGAVRRLHPHVVGDGVSTIGELIDEKNTFRRRNPNNARFPIPKDEATITCLEHVGHSLESVLPEGERVIVRRVGGISSGGDAQECLQDIDVEGRHLATAAVAAIPGMDGGGVDAVISRKTGRPYVLAINSDASVSNSTYPVYGTPTDAATHAWKRMLGASIPEPDTVAQAEWHESPLVMAVAVKGIGLTLGAPTTLAGLFRSYLRHWGWTVTPSGGTVDRVTSPDGAEAWFHYCIDEHLHKTVTVALTRHRTIRSMLRQNGTKMPPAKRVRSQSELTEFARQRDESIGLVPWDRGWSARRDPNETELTSAAERGNKSLNLLAQRAPDGERFRVFASRARTIAVVSAPGVATVSRAQVDALGDTAARAVRAIPGLRWAAVDIVLPAARPSAPLVEGLSLNPVLDVLDTVVAGSIGDVLTTIAGENLDVAGSAARTFSAEPPADPALDEAAAPAQPVPNTYLDAESVEIIRQNVTLGRSLGALAISRAAVREGATLDWLSAREVWAVLDDRRVPITGHFGTESALASQIVGDKVLAKELMANAGVSVPAGRHVDSANDAIQAQKEIGRPIVVKPRRGSMGRGATVNVTDPQDIRDGFYRAQEVANDVIVEQYVHGLEYRAHATPNECVGVFRRLLPSVTGDGHSTVAQLVEEKNELRKLNPTTRVQPIPMDGVSDGLLQRQGLTRDSVLSEGQRIIVRNVNGITSGGDSEECLDLVDDSLKQTAAAAVAAIPGMDWGGVDILVEEDTGTPYVMEVNSDAAINGSTFPVYGTPRDLGTVLWRRMYHRSVPDPTEDPIALSPGDALVPIPAVPDTTAEVKTLQELLTDHLRSQGWRITMHSSRLWSAEEEGERVLWFRNVLTAGDSLISIRPLRGPLQLRKVLRRMDIPRPRARLVNNIEELRSFREKMDTTVSLMPSTGRHRPITIGVNDPIDAHLLDGQNAWFVQTHRPGLRFRVLATPIEALAAVAPSEQRMPEADAIRRASELAVRAVRALPQLRWAAVDISIGTGARGANAVVEHLSVLPTFEWYDTIVAGSMDSVFDMLVAGASDSPGAEADNHHRPRVLGSLLTRVRALRRRIG